MDLMTSDRLKEQVGKLPGKPGIYLFKSKNKSLYIGKASNLKSRTNNYLKTSDPRLKKMIAEADRLDHVQTDSDIEALILESKYIKRFRPDFNIMLRDDKQYFFVGFTQENFPKIFLTHQPNNNFKFKILNSKLNSALAEFIGPFTDGNALKITLRLLRKIFPYCTCKQLHNNYCLNYHIGKCPGFCCLKNSELRITNYELSQYKKNLKAIREILSGKKSSVIKKLDKEMKNQSQKQEYEEAMELQYKIDRIKRVFENARILQSEKYKAEASEIAQDVLKELAKAAEMEKVPNRIEAYDIANIQGNHAVGAMVVFMNGVQDKNEYRKFKIYTKKTADDTGMLKEVLARRFKHPEWQFPDLILIDGGKGQLNAAKNVVSSMQQVARVKIIALTKDERHIGTKIITDNGIGIFLTKLSPDLKNLLLRIDSEAHRFAISYYRKSHRRSVTK
jgi:excinuclease ABC subunit C